MYKKHFEYFFLAAICGGLGFAVTYISKISENIQLMTTSLQVLAEKLTAVDRATQDHEIRIRNLERGQ